MLRKHNFLRIVLTLLFPLLTVSCLKKHDFVFSQTMHEYDLEGNSLIIGKVIDKKTHEPLVSADLSITELNIPIKTDNAGYYKIEINSPGLYNLSVFYIGFKSEIIKFQIKENQIIVQNFALDYEIISAPPNIRVVTQK